MAREDWVQAAAISEVAKEAESGNGQP